MKILTESGNLEPIDIVSAYQSKKGGKTKTVDISPTNINKKDVYLDNLHQAINEGRGTKQYPFIGYARLNTMLQKLGKSKKNWSRDILIGNILDATHPAKYFWYLVKENKKK